MATTDAKPGFRLPWSADRSESGEPAAETPAATADPSTPSQELETTDMIDAAPAASDNEAAVVDAAGADPVVEAAQDAPAPEAPAPAPETPAAPAPAPATSTRKPNKFLADLTKAMQAAAESARAESLERVNAEAKATIETIHADSANEATELRKRADDDVAAVREWSKQEIARIREETDERITHRKERLEREIEEHAGEIEARIERVQARVTAFETEMSEFFERLLAEEDPTRFAAMAESLPEPPPFDHDEPYHSTSATSAPTQAVAAASTPAEAVADPVVTDDATPVDAQAEAGDPTEVEIEAPVAEGDAEAASGPWTDEAAPIVPATPESTATESPATDAGDLFSIGADDASAADPADPRLSALGITPDFAAAEAEAATFDAGEAGADEVVPEIPDETVAARIAGLVPDGEAAGAAATTRVSVLGLVSVASIAGFKRHLSRATGVQSVGVSSGPDGEFVFTVEHDATVALKDIIPTLPGFAARVTGDADGQLTVTAQDPEAES
jgi:hypothetical protein